MSRVRFSNRSEADLLDIFAYGITQLGVAQAERYRADLEACFQLIAERPLMGRLARNVTPNIRRHEHGRHVIFYEPDGDGVIVLALIHQRSIRRLVLD